MTQASETAPRPASASSGRGGKSPHPNLAQRIATYNRQVVAELRKVIWPTRNELMTYTVVSVTFVVFMIALVALFDYVFTKFVFSVFS